ncbi:hypothetical protein IFR04_004184 [Cadophora malorum]|uniref:2EXR domain-containing protein n=1 Tax=Cadophora malorum TaxID=108018 RepID=A0A8H8BSM2_9HELO|nr:hypothetical protein IFR04_004184 [Cadophora malorum]
MLKNRRFRLDLFKRLTRKGKGSKSASPSSTRVNSSSSLILTPHSSNDASVAKSEQSLDVLVQSFSEMALTKFTKFPELPIELRRLIFLYSLPKEIRILPVAVTLKEADEEFGLYFTFALSPIQRPLPLSAPKDHFDTALLCACRESREVYLENNKSKLPAGFKSIIHYNPEHTMVLIQNFEDLQMNRHFAEGIRKSWRKQKWITEIKQLAVPIWAFLVDFDMMESLWEDDGYGGMMRIFESLDRWIGIISPGDLSKGREKTQKGHMKIMADVVQRELKTYRREINPSYKVPLVEVFEVIGYKGNGAY